jgi:DNA modification methylase
MIDECVITTDDSTITLREGRFEDTLMDIHHESVDLVFTSPPFNLGGFYLRRDNNPPGARSYTWDSGGYQDDLPERDYIEWQMTSLLWMRDVIRPCGNILYHHQDRFKDGNTKSPMSIIMPLVESGDIRLKQTFVLDFGSTHRHGKDRFPQIHQYLYDITRYDLPPMQIYLNREPLPWNGDYPSSVWRDIPRQKGDNHCAPFHIDLARHVVRCFSPPGGLVCDPFSGSGTTALACLIEGRRFIGSELLHEYHEVAMRRILSHAE